MPRPVLRAAAGSTVRVRPADIADLPALLGLHAEVDTPSRLMRHRRVHAAGSADPHPLEDQLCALIEAPDSELVVATIQDQAIGMAALTTGSASVLDDVPAVLVSRLVVAGSARHRGVGRALLAAAVGYADARGLDAVSVTAWPTDRDSNRYFARLGFAPVSVRRLAPVPVLRRKLGVAAADEALPPAVRRRLRLRAATEAADSPPL